MINVSRVPSPDENTNSPLPLIDTVNKYTIIEHYNNWKNRKTQNKQKQKKNLEHLRKLKKSPLSISRLPNPRLALPLAPSSGEVDRTILKYKTSSKLPKILQHTKNIEIAQNTAHEKHRNRSKKLKQPMPILWTLRIRKRTSHSATRSGDMPNQLKR